MRRLLRSAFNGAAASLSLPARGMETRLFRRAFLVLLSLSLALFAVVVTLWAWSYRSGFHFSHRAAGGTYSLRSSSGWFVISGPPIDGADDETMKQIALRMSNDDIAWGKPILRRDGWFIEGDARVGSATWEMFQRVRNKDRELEGLEGAERLWMQALDDPNKFVPAHMMLLLFTQRWREANVWDDVPEVFLPSSPEATKPDLSHWRETRRDWHDRLDVTVYSLPLAMAAAATLIVPLLWFTQPRHPPKRLRKWVFNALSAASLLLCVTSGVLWARSHGASEYWAFADKHGEPFPFEEEMIPTVRHRWIGSAKGQLHILSRITVHWPKVRHPYKAEPVGYHRGWHPLAAFIRATGEQHWSGPGLEFYAMPFHAVNQLPASGNGLAYINGFVFVPSGNVTYSNVLSMWGGYRSINISWWLIVLATLIGPLFWGLGWSRVYLRLRQRRRHNCCLTCGYDLRATPDRCPECGTAPAGVAK